MGHKKQLFDSTWISNEIAALRAEQPEPETVERAVSRVLAAPVERKRLVTRVAWRSVATVGGVAASALLIYSTTRRAGAATLHDIASALRQHSTRHWIDERPDASGNMKFRGEWWIEGSKFASYYEQPDGKFWSGCDGSRTYQVFTNGSSFVDDVPETSVEGDSVDSYLSDPNATVLGHKVGVTLDEQTVDLYSVGYSNVRFDLYVNPATRLPVRRDVFSTGGRLTERELYDYPANIADNVFTPPNTPGIVDYPLLRSELATRLNEPGQTKAVGGVKITLRAVILGQGKVMALWTGGAKADGSRSDVMWIENQERASITARPNTFSITPFRPTNPAETPITVDNEPLHGDAVWLLEGGTNRHTYIEGPFKINVPVWAEDRTRPIVGKHGENLGYHSKLVGRLTFDVTDPIRADDPDRVVWRPTGDVEQATTSIAAPKP